MVVSENQMKSDRAREMINIVQKMAYMFPNLDQKMNSLLLVISKVEKGEKND